MAINYDIVQKSGAWFSFENEKIGQGKETARKFLSDTPKLLAKIEKMVITAAKEKTKEAAK
jgi:recombination protein RecA